MVAAHDLPHLAHEAAHPPQHPLALDRVGLDDLPLARVELARLVDDLLGDRDLADVVQQRGKFHVSPSLQVEPESLGDVEREPDHVLAVRAGVGVIGLDHVP